MKMAIAFIFAKIAIVPSLRRMQIYYDAKRFLGIISYTLRAHSKWVCNIYLS